jgi:DNA repair protein RadA/Sms
MGLNGVGVWCLGLAERSEDMKSHFVCQNCGASSLKWYGKCPACGEYNTMVEEVIAVQKKHKKAVHVKPLSLAEIPLAKEGRSKTGNVELDRVLGGGFVAGSLLLLGGDPGIGKSTLMLQISDILARAGKTVLYVNGEESGYQTKVRAARLKVKGEGIAILSATELETILATAKEQKCDFMVVDSIQTVYKASLSSAPGSVAQVRECGADLMRFAKENSITTVIIGHVTKYGMIAGPKTLEHIVDTVLYFEGDKNQQYRIIRTIKNRFGSTNEIGVFEMSETGLKEVPNPSGLFISGSVHSGSAVISIIEGSRPLLVEVQALTSPALFSYPQRVATGIDEKRLSMLLAVLERRVGLSVHNVDCFVNVVGGIRVTETSSDLGIILAIASSLKNMPIENAVVIGEVGLGGEVRPVRNLNARLKEAGNLGFRRAFVPGTSDAARSAIEAILVHDVREAVDVAFGHRNQE